jgi:hypothetical protein
MPTDNELKLIEQLRGALKSRALVYAAMYEEIAAEFGADKAREICKRAIYKRGESIAHLFAHHAPADLAGLKDTFLAFIPQGEQLFAPEVVQCNEHELEIQFHRCPLKEAWQEAGIDGQALENLCDIGGVVDYGTFEKAGFSITSDTWKRGREGCCRLHIRPGPR